MNAVKAVITLWLAALCVAAPPHVFAQAVRELPDFTRLVDDQGNAVVNISTTQAPRRTGATPHRVTLFGTKAVADQQGDGDYAPLVVEIVKFFQTKVAPVAPEETIELFAFMEAADESKRRGGAPVSIAEVLKQAGWEGPQ